MSIASKEARETRYWIKILNESDLVNIDLDEYIKEINQIIAILTKIIKTTVSS